MKTENCLTAFGNGTAASNHLSVKEQINADKLTDDEHSCEDVNTSLLQKGISL